MTSRRRLTTRQRVAIFEAAHGICHLCKIKITVKDRWDLDHVIPLALGGLDEPQNLQPAHERCHERKTSAIDVPAIAKSERVKSKFIGAKIKGRWGSGRRTPWKTKIDGTVVRR